MTKIAPAPWRHAVESRDQRSDDLQSSHGLLYAGVIVVFLLPAIFLAVRKPLWYDELFTLYVAQSPTISDVIHKLQQGVDLHPPVSHLLTRASIAVFGNNEGAVRLPSLLGFGLAGFSLFAFVGRRMGWLYGLSAGAILMLTDAYAYAYEARPYGLVLGFCGAAMLAWQIAAEQGERRGLSLALLALALFAAFGSHYYAVLMVIPLLAAEVYRWWMRRRLDWPMIAAILIPTASMTLYLPLIRAGMALGNKHPWNPPKLSALVDLYRAPIDSAVMPLLVCCVLMYLLTLRPRWRIVESANDSEDGGLARHECVFAGAMILVPLAGFFLARGVTNMITPRYTLIWLLAFAVVIAGSVRRFTRGSSLAAYSVVILLCLWFVQSKVREVLAARTLSRPSAPAILQTAELRSLPVLSSDALMFFPLYHYSGPELRARLGMAADGQLALRYMSTDIVDNGLFKVAPHFGLPVTSWADYRSRTHDFLLLWRPHRLTWILNELAAEGYSLRAVWVNGDTIVFRVTRQD